MGSKRIALFSLIGHEKEHKGYEGSSEDYMQDYASARRRGQSVEHYEDTAKDRIQDHAGERRMREKEAKREAIQHETHYKPGVSAFNSPSKYSHGYGHEHKQGQLRLSGAKGAHQIGKKK